MDARRIIIAGERRAELEAFALDTRGLGPGEVVVRTLATLISPGTEGAAFLGLKPPGRATEGGYPQRVGYASVGKVLEAGPEAGRAAGQRVYSMSGHVSAFRLDTRENLLLPVPDGLPPEEAVFARMATVSMASLRTTAARGGDRAAVVGLGLVGNLAGQLCEIAGMPATGVDLLPGRCDVARRCGLTTVLEAPSPEELRAEHALVLECTGTPRGALTALALTGRGGELALVGAPWGRGGAEVTAHAVLERVFAGYVRMRSGWEWQLPVFPADFTAGSHAENSRLALELIREGRLRVRELLTHRLPPEAAQEAYAGAVDRKDEYMGVVFSWESA
jgi:2-desacetyl-2-hydroxyethyl bacteriochlorophyllide A dehydrogenase